ncbi:MAG: sigma 54-interacting transcriptional regulator [Pseudomonadota bacterium]
MEKDMPSIETLRSELIGDSPAMDRVRKSISKIAPTNLPVLVVGETGVGKEIVVRLIHRLSERSDKPFVAVNMAAVPESLASATLFGHVRGAFTGATSDRLGLVQIADGGTLFFDELEVISQETQRLILSFLDTGTFVPLGGEKRRTANVRFIAAARTHPNDLTSVVPDLLARISGFVLEIPSLRERTEDIPQLAEYFLGQFRTNTGVPRRFSVGAMAALRGYRFPGNVRELRMIVERAAIMSEVEAIQPHDLGLRVEQEETRRDTLEQLRNELSHTRRELTDIRRNAIPADPIWQGRWISMEQDYCFVLMPFSESHDLQIVYKEHVKPVIEGRCGLRCERADDINDISGIMQSVWESINKARVIIADLTDRNSNVFYELGIAHTLGKPVIMITQSMDYVPFDLRHLRCIVYDFKPGRIERFQESLEKTIRTVLSSSPGPSFALMQE